MIERNGFTKVTDMAYSLYLDLVSLGFNLKFFRNYGGRFDDYQLINPFPVSGEPSADLTAIYVFESTVNIDPFGKAEPWEIVLEVHPRYMRVWVLTSDSYDFDEYGVMVIKNMPNYLRFSDKGIPDNEIDDGDEFHYNYGYLSGKYYKVEQPFVNFLDFNEENSNWGIEHYELEGSPLKYIISTDGTGVFVGFSSEPHADKGNCFAWFAVGRLTDTKGQIKTSYRSRPVWCVYSLDGGGSNAIDDASALRPNGIRQFCVREADIVYPTDSTSAVIPGQRFNAILNPVQQTSLDEQGRAILSRVQGFSNYRFKYAQTPYFPIMAYASADIAEETEIVLDTDQEFEVNYHAWLSNSSTSKGMRVYIGESVGRDFDSGVLYKMLVSDWSVGFQDTGVRLHLVSVRVTDALSGQLVNAVEDMPFTVDILGSTTTLIGDDTELHDGNIISPPNGIFKVSTGKNQYTLQFAEHRPSEQKGRNLKLRISFPTMVGQDSYDLELIL